MSLKWVKYPYSPQWSPDGLAYRPALDVEVSNGSKLRIIFALVDSGTDSMVLDASLASSLGIDPDTCEKRLLSGIGGNSQGFMAEIEVKVKGFTEKIKARALFLQNAPFTALLGQRDFFDNFYIRFEHRKRFFLLAKAPKQKAVKQAT
jgi:hypothetical protein